MIRFSVAAAACLAAASFGSLALATEVPLDPVQKGGPIQLPVPGSRSFFTKVAGCSRLPIVIGQQVGKDGEYSDNKLQVDSIACLASKQVTVTRAEDGSGTLNVTLQLGFQRPGTTPVFAERSFATSFQWTAGGTIPAGTFYAIDMPALTVQPAIDAAARNLKVFMQLQLPSRDVDAPSLSFKLVNKKPDAQNAAAGPLVNIPFFERYN